MSRAPMYTPEQKAYIEARIGSQTCAEIAQQMNEIWPERHTTVCGLHGFIKNHGLKSGCHHRPKGRPTELWPQAARDYVAKHLPTETYAQCAEQLKELTGKSYSRVQIMYLACRMGIKSGSNGRFTSARHGGYRFAPGCPEGEKTRFRTGGQPHNTKPVGTVRQDGREGYLRVKVAQPNVWKYVHNMVWEEHHGPIPKGGIVLHLDGNVENNDIGNLECVTRKELALMAKLRGYSADAEITKTNILIAKIRILSHRRDLKDEDDKGTGV